VWLLLPQVNRQTAVRWLAVLAAKRLPVESEADRVPGPRTWGKAGEAS
jgi:hypothetical protein